MLLLLTDTTRNTASSTWSTETAADQTPLGGLFTSGERESERARERERVYVSPVWTDGLSRRKDGSILHVFAGLPACLSVC